MRVSSQGSEFGSVLFTPNALEFGRFRGIRQREGCGPEIASVRQYLVGPREAVMSFRNFVVVAGLGLLVMGSSVNAAVSVFGTGLSQSCFQAAEFGGSAKDGITACTVALDEEGLSAHDRAATMINRGILYGRVDDAAAALEDYNNGLAIDATLGEGYVDRGAAEIVLKDYDAALTDISKGIELHAQKPEIAYYDRAIVNEALGNVRDAYEDYKKAVELQPDFPLANEQLMRFKVVHKQHGDGA
jgi:tetratricopeptide (TPR) repeat protein